MRIKRLAGCVGVVAAVFVAVQSAVGQALVDRVPADAFAYVGWAGSNDLTPAYNQSRLKKFVDQSTLPATLDQALADTLTRMTTHGKDNAADVKLMSHFVKLMLHHPLAVFAAAPAKDSDDQSLRLGLICQPGDDHDVLMALFEKIATQEQGKNQHVRAIDDGDVITLTIGYADSSRPIAPDPNKQFIDDVAKPADPLGRASSFNAIKSQISSAPAIVAYVDGPNWLAYLDQAAAATGDPQIMAAWKVGRDSSGLAGVRQYVYSAGFAGDEWTSQSFLGAPGERTGLLKLIEPSAVDPKLLARVPADAISFSVGQFNLAQLFGTAREVVTAISPQGGADLQKWTGLLSLTIGRRLDSEILGPLGSQWVWYASPSLGRNGIANTVLVNKLANAQLATESWADVSAALSNTLPAVLKRLGVTATPVLDDQLVPNAHVFSIQINQTNWKPGFVVKDQFIYFGVDPNVLAKAATAADSPGVEKNETFRGALSKLGTPAHTSFVYNDLAATADQAAANFPALWAMLRERANIAFDFPPNMLPPTEKIKPLLEPSVSAKWADAKGFYAREREPFPFAATVYGNTESEETEWLATGSVVFALRQFVPAVNQNFQLSLRLKSAVNLRSLYTAMELYAKDHQGAAPPDVGSLVMQGVVPNTFMSPAGKTAIPADIFNAAPEVQAAWINVHSDYVYLKPAGLLKTASPDAPIAYEKIGLQGKIGTNMLFSNGRVEFVQAGKAIELIQKTGNQAVAIPSTPNPPAQP